MGDLQGTGCWIPNTPVKSGLSESQQICKDSGDSTNLCGLNDSFENWEAAWMRKHHPDATAAKLGDHNAMSNSSDYIFRTGFEGTRFETSDTTPAVAKKFIPVGPNMWVNRGYIPSTPKGDSTPTHHNFDLNTPLKGLIDAVSTDFPSMIFSPITPDQSKKTENSSNHTAYEQLANYSSSVVASTQGKETPLKGLGDSVSTNFPPSIFSPVTPDQSKKTENSSNHTRIEQLENCSSSVVASTQVEENHNPDADQQKMPKLKRKKHRPKVVKEGQAKRGPKPANSKPGGNSETPKIVRKYVKKTAIDKIQSLPKVTADNKETPKAKRKYVRKNMVEKTPEFNSGEVASVDTKKETRERKSCKKRIIFDEKSLDVEESSLLRSPRNEKTESQVPNDHAESQAQNFHVGVESNSPVQLGQGSETISGNRKMDVIPDLGAWEQSESKKGKCRIVFSDKTHDKDVPIVEVVMSNNAQPPPSLDVSNCNNLTSSHEREEARGMKRGRENIINWEQQKSTKVSGGHYNLLPNFVPLFPANAYGSNRMRNTYISHANKAKQPEQRHSGTTSIASSSGTKEANAYNFNNVYNASYGPQMNFGYWAAGQYYPRIYQTQNMSFSAQLQQQNFEYQRLLKYGKMMTEMGHSQAQYYVAEGASTSGDLQVYQRENPSHVHVEIKVAKTRKTTAKGNIGRKIAAVRRKKKPTADDITEYLRLLQIDPEYEDKRALVLYNGAGMVVPFEGPFNPIKKRRERAKVNLDEETSKVWRLLLENINSEGIDGTDEEKAKWWENERHVFKGRAESFIARMHLVQGDRRFSPWKGSVVDSVVGVFLTQNVSDHASSSAFMSMAAHFPIKTKASFDPTFEESNISVKEKQVEIFESDDTVNSSNPNGSKATFMELLQMAESQRKIQNSENGCMSSYTENVHHFTYQSQRTQNFAGGLHKPSSHSPNGSEENYSSEQSEITEESGSQDTTQKVSQIIFQKEVISVDVIKSTGHNHGSTTGISVVTSDLKKGNTGKKKVIENPIDWDILRLKAQEKGKREKTPNTMDSLDWEAVWRADVDEVAATIKERGMNNVLAERIQAFLNRLVTEHGSIDLEWLRDVPPDKAKEYLLSIRGLGLKSVECVRLLTLHHLAFPVDTNVGRIAVRLGWVPLQPLPESLQLHLLEMYPIMESIQQYLWPRLCKLDQRTLYELHYQMITFGKVFCTKSKPNCNACPMKGECRHFASAFASARLPLPGPEEKRMVNTTQNQQPKQNSYETIERLQLPEPQPSLELQTQPQIHAYNPTVRIPATPIVTEPIIEVPSTPEPEILLPESDIEDVFPEDPDEIPMIKLNIEKFTQTLQNYMDGDMSKALVALTQEAASIPMPKLKNVNQLRTEHQVYELPDSHPLLEGMDKREPDDPSSYLLAIWTPGETANSIEQPQSKCSSYDFGNLCEVETCFSCNSIREANSQTVRGTILIPCRTATRGSFPLNGTYFQVNEVFADHASSLKPIDVPRSLIWNLPRRMVYFGTSIPTIFKGLSTETIQYCFWKGFVCVRGFDQKTRAPRPLIARLHFPASRLPKANAKTNEKKD